MMASDTRQSILSEGLDARGILEAVLPYAAALFFFLALLVAALDERRCEGAADESAGTLAPVVSAGPSVPAADGECRPVGGASSE
jgi:hypothetical protein